MPTQQFSGLDQDPVFRAVLAKRMVYPRMAIGAKVFTKTSLFTHFKIDSAGHIQDIRTLNPSETDYGFEKTINQALRKLPPLKPVYEGNYILPVRFSFLYSKGVVEQDTMLHRTLDYGALQLLKALYPGQTILKEQLVETYGSPAYRPRK
ncbi:hypothetical protein WBJ53_16065 [Spirosoma sp. SC4-14]|uniref:hypothetical protein n=1 Tax=Spirosoma sp. SC4-14 TaxID=3128900 RepID=UPI0030CFC485